MTAIWTLKFHISTKISRVSRRWLQRGVGPGHPAAMAQRRDSQHEARRHFGVQDANYHGTWRGSREGEHPDDTIMDGRYGSYDLLDHDLISIIRCAVADLSR